MSRLPDGFAVRLSGDVRVGRDGRTVLGGMPVCLVKVGADLAPHLRAETIRVDGARSRALVEALLNRGLVDPYPEPRQAVRGQVTVVVPVKDRPAGLERLLATVPAGVAVIVVDDGSVDDEAVARVVEAAGAHLHRSEVSRGPAHARNLGLSLAATEFVLFCDSDVELDPGSVDTLLAHFDDTRVGVAAPRILARECSGGWLARYEAACSSLDLGPRPALVRPRSRVSYVPSACLMVRRSAVAGGFDPQMHVAEDVDLVWRLAASGWAVRYEPRATARHDHRTGFCAWFGRRRFYGTGAALLAARHGSAVAPVVLAPWSTAAVLLLGSRRHGARALGALLVLAAVLRIAGKLEHSRTPVRDAARLAGGGLVSTVLQGAAVVTRHWWPLTLVGCVVSRRFRRVALTAAVLDGALDYATRRPDLDPLRFWLARRLDDLAYGAGLWWGCCQARDARALGPAVTRW